jgi:hypothetical protein
LEERVSSRKKTNGLVVEMKKINERGKERVEEMRAK